MTILWKAKTQQGYTIKILAELLQNNIKTACFEVDEKGVQLCMMDNHRRILISIVLNAENFHIYRFNAKSKLFLGINLNHLHKMLKNIKKKDSVTLLIKDDDPTILAIEVTPRDRNRVTTSFVKIQARQNIDIEVPTGYAGPIIVQSNEYQKMCKDMNSIGNIITVLSKKYLIKFSCDQGGVYSREVVFGEKEDDEEEEVEEGPEYTEKFDTEHLIRIVKIAGLSSQMQIYPKNDLPLLFRSNVGSLGKISIYIKCRKQIEEEEYASKLNYDIPE